MAERSKGSWGTDEYLGKNEAAKLLEVPPTTLMELVRQGIVVPEYDEDGGLLFSKRDILLTRESHLGARDMPVWEIASIAQQALATARVSQQRLCDLQDLLGLNHVALDRGEETLYALWEGAMRPLHPKRLASPQWVRYWAGVFFAFDEVYLRLIGKYTASKEPWKHFYDFSSRVLHAKPLEEVEVSPALRHAYLYFEGARKHLLMVSYYYCRNKHGKRVAEKVFPKETRTGLDQVMDCLLG